MKQIICFVNCVLILSSMEVTAQYGATPQKAIFKGFRQGSRDNCAFVAVIKAAISTFGTDSVFRKVSYDQAGNRLVYLKNRADSITITPKEINLVRRESKFKAGESNYVYNDVYELSILCYAVMAKVRNPQLSFRQNLEEMTKGADVVEVSGYLGLTDYVERKKFLSPTKGLCGLIVGNKRHAAFACDGKIDLWGKTKKMRWWRGYWSRVIIRRTPKIPSLTLAGAHLAWSKNEHPCCISGIEWNDSDQMLYFISDSWILNKFVYKTSLKFDLRENNNFSINPGRSDSIAIDAPFTATDGLETIRIHNGSIFVSLESERSGKDSLITEIWTGRLNQSNTPLSQVHIASMTGKKLCKNSGIEGIAISNEGKYLWTIAETGFRDHRGHPLVKKSGIVETTYEYTADQTPPTFYGGVSEILDYNENKFIVLERYYSVPRKETLTKIYLCTLTTDLHVSKTLLLDLKHLPIKIDNYEGMTWGPRLPNGKRSLILISDDNNHDGKQKHQSTDLLMFELTD